MPWLDRGLKTNCLCYQTKKKTEGCALGLDVGTAIYLRTHQSLPATPVTKLLLLPPKPFLELLPIPLHSKLLPVHLRSCGSSPCCIYSGLGTANIHGEVTQAKYAVKTQEALGLPFQGCPASSVAACIRFIGIPTNVPPTYKHHLN